jgi:hypothetical protein
MADCAIGRHRILGLGAAAGAGLRRLRFGRDQMSDEVRIGPRTRPHRGSGLSGLVGVSERDEGVAQRAVSCPETGRCRGFPVQVASAVPRFFRKI